MREREREKAGKNRIRGNESRGDTLMCECVHLYKGVVTRI